MNIYTKSGDKGTTDLVRTKNVSKSDDRIQLVGTIDELTSHLGLVKTSDGGRRRNCCSGKDSAQADHNYGRMWRSL